VHNQFSCTRLKNCINSKFTFIIIKCSKLFNFYY